MLILPDFDPSVWAAAGLSVILVLIAFTSRRHYLALPEIKPLDPPTVPTSPPDCMVVIPARNEQGQIGNAVSSLPPDTVIVVDDFSDDETTVEARKAGAGVLAASTPLEGVLGKSNACAQGARVLTSRWILFADADTSYQPGFLEAAVTAAESSKLDFLSIYLRPEYQTPWEWILSPFAAALYFSGIDPRADAPSAFNGQCILVRRNPYEFVGGHKALLTSVCEDVRMAELAQRHRMAFAVVRAPHLGCVRIRPDDFERNARRFGVRGLTNGARIMAAAAAWALWLPVLVWLLMGQHWIVAAIFLLVPSLCLQPWYGWKRAILAPLGIYALLPTLIRGMVGALMHHHVEWKGRVT